jgi:hypothetical protein
MTTTRSANPPGGSRLSLLVLLACGALSVGPALAQAPPTPATPMAPTAPTGVPSAANCKPGEVAPPGTTTGQGAPHGAQPLGDQLAKSDGVLCPPPDVDPEIRAPAPGGGNTPVIPPPGSPGGDPTLRPK